MIESNAWVDKFQPKKIADCFLPKTTKEHLLRIVSTGDVPSMFFAGPAGIGKTTTAIAICEELDLEYMLINASLHGNIDTVRTDIQSFSSTISFNGKKKVIILDEADGLTAAAQASLRAVINEYTNNVAFILTANFRNKIIEPLISRFDEVEFLFAKEELPTLAKGIYQFIINRLNEEGVEHDVSAVQQFIKSRLTKSSDIRKTLIEAQRIAKTGVFNKDSLINLEDSRLIDVILILKKKNYDSIRTWAGENSDLDFSVIARFLYDNIRQISNPNNYFAIVGIINEHQYKHSFVVDKEINLVSLLAEISLSL